MTGAVKSRGGCWTRFKLLPFVMIFSGAATLALIAVWAACFGGMILFLELERSAVLNESNYAVEAGRATADMLEVLLSTESSVFKIIDAYGVVVGITVGWAAAIVAFALVMSFWKLYLSSSKISASGPPGGAWWQSFGWVASILLTMVAMFMVWLVLMIVLIAVWMVAMAVIEEAAKASQRLLQSLIDVASDLPLNSLFTFPGRGGETVQDLFDKYERQVDDGSLSADDAKDMFVTDVLTDFGPPGAANNTEVREQYERYLEDAITRTVAASSNSTDTPCPTSVCLDLSLYDFLDSDACLCNPEDIQRIRDYADDAFDNLLVGLVLAAACYMAVTVMLIKLSRDQKGVLKDWHWICEMRAMTPASMKLPPPPAGEDPITTSAGRLHDDSAGANARGAHTVPVAAV